MAQAWLVLEITDSTFYVGIVNATPAVILMLLSPFGGVLADRFDVPRRCDGPVGVRPGLRAQAPAAAFSRRVSPVCRRFAAHADELAHDNRGKPVHHLRRRRSPDDQIPRLAEWLSS